MKGLALVDVARHDGHHLSSIDIGRPDPNLRCRNAVMQQGNGSKRVRYCAVVTAGLRTVPRPLNLIGPDQALFNVFRCIPSSHTSAFSWPITKKLILRSKVIRGVFKRHGSSPVAASLLLAMPWLRLRHSSAGPAGAALGAGHSLTSRSGATGRTYAMVVLLKVGIRHDSTQGRS